MPEVINCLLCGQAMYRDGKRRRHPECQHAMQRARERFIYGPRMRMRGNTASDAELDRKAEEVWNRLSRAA